MPPTRGGGARRRPRPAGAAAGSPPRPPTSSRATLHTPPWPMCRCMSQSPHHPDPQQQVRQPPPVFTRCVSAPPPPPPRLISSLRSPLTSLLPCSATSPDATSRTPALSTSSVTSRPTPLPPATRVRRCVLTVLPAAAVPLLRPYADLPLSTTPAVRQSFRSKVRRGRRTDSGGPKAVLHRRRARADPPSCLPCSDVLRRHTKVRLPPSFRST